jgi:hypothetical protein
LRCIHPRVGWFTELEGKHNHECIRFEGVIIFNECFPYAMVKAIGI